MKEITAKAMLTFVAYSLLLFSVALLAGCDVTRYAFNCTVVQPENCN